MAVTKSSRSVDETRVAFKLGRGSTFVPAAAGLCHSRFSPVGSGFARLGTARPGLGLAFSEQEAEGLVRHPPPHVGGYITSVATIGTIRQHATLDGPCK